MDKWGNNNKIHVHYKEDFCTYNRQDPRCPSPSSAFGGAWGKEPFPWAGRLPSLSVIWDKDEGTQICKPWSSDCDGSQADVCVDLYKGIREICKNSKYRERVTGALPNAPRQSNLIF